MRKLFYYNGLRGVNYLLAPSLTISTLIFVIGMSVNFFIYISRGTIPNAIMDAGAVFLLTLNYILLLFKKITANRATILHVLILSVNFCGSILFEAFSASADAPLWILITMSFSVIPVLFAGMAAFRALPLFIGISICLAYLAAGIVLDDKLLISQLPTFILLYLGLSLGYTYILSINRRIEHENMRMTREQENIMEYFYFTPRQWEQIRAGRMDRSKLESVMRRMERNEREKSQLKYGPGSAEGNRIKEVIGARFRHLTDADLELCRLIVQGYSTVDIARIQGLKLQSITSRRSRLRTKIGLPPDQNLNNYLHILTAEDRR